jgi:uncharacterized membrane protein YciS (DUF1049 family)
LTTELSTGFVGVLMVVFLVCSAFWLAPSLNVMRTSQKWKKVRFCFCYNETLDHFMIKLPMVFIVFEGMGERGER